MRSGLRNNNDFHELEEEFPSTREQRRLEDNITYLSNRGNIYRNDLPSHENCLCTLRCLGCTLLLSLLLAGMIALIVVIKIFSHNESNNENVTTQAIICEGSFKLHSNITVTCNGSVTSVNKRSNGTLQEISNQENKTFAISCLQETKNQVNCIGPSVTNCTSFNGSFLLIVNQIPLASFNITEQPDLTVNLTHESNLTFILQCGASKVCQSDIQFIANENVLKANKTCSNESGNATDGFTIDCSVTVSSDNVSQYANNTALYCSYGNTKQQFIRSS